MASTFVKDIMKKNVITIDKAESIQDAAQKMLTANVGCVIVTKSLSVSIPTGMFPSVITILPTFASSIIAAASLIVIEESIEITFFVITSFTKVNAILMPHLITTVSYLDNLI